MLLPCRVWWRDGNREREKIFMELELYLNLFQKLSIKQTFGNFWLNFLKIICIEVVSGFSPGPWHPSGPRLWAGSSSPRSPHCSACSYQTWQLQTEKNECLSIYVRF